MLPIRVEEGGDGLGGRRLRQPGAAVVRVAHRALQALEEYDQGLRMENGRVKKLI